MREASRLVLLVLAAATALDGSAVQLALPLKPGSVRFAVIGDSGTGERAQYEVGAQMLAYHRAFPFDFVLMLGDNLYGSEGPADYARKFERPSAALLERGVRFFAALGNHDTPSQRFYRLFNMGGERYYTFTDPSGQVRFFALDTTYLDRAQLRWLEASLSGSGEAWKICFFHHPLYSSGRRHGPELGLRAALEPLFLTYGVDVVFAGHEHFYERLHPQRGIYYFISGAAGQLRRGNIRPSPATAQGFDQDRHFLLIEIAGDELYFQAVARDGRPVDAGSLTRPS